MGETLGETGLEEVAARRRRLVEQRGVDDGADGREGAGPRHSGGAPGGAAARKVVPVAGGRRRGAGGSDCFWRGREGEGPMRATCLLGIMLLAVGQLPG